MQIAVIGTSNSLLKGGYVDGIRSHHATNIVDNFSLGFSASSLLARLSGEKTFSGYDFIVLDFAVNEEDYVYLNLTTTDEIKARLMHFLSTSVHGPAIPVVVIMPTTHGYDTLKPVHKFYAEFAKELGILCFDGFDWLASYAETNGVLISALFQDTAHLRPNVAYEFGRHIAGVLSNARNYAHKKGYYNDFIVDYLYRDLTKEAYRDIIRRESSLLIQDVVKIEKCQNIKVLFGDIVTIVSVGINIAQTSDRVIIDNGSETSGAAEYKEYASCDNKSLIYIIAPVKPITGTEFSIYVGRDGRGGTEIGGLVCHRGSFSRPTPIWSGLR